eukprot:15366773-Ditylum_brightwellii.AAC.1
MNHGCIKNLATTFENTFPKDKEEEKEEPPTSSPLMQQPLYQPSCPVMPLSLPTTQQQMTPPNSTKAITGTNFKSAHKEIFKVIHNNISKGEE